MLPQQHREQNVFQAKAPISTPATHAAAHAEVLYAASANLVDPPIERVSALRTELQSMRMRALLQRAEEDGIEERLIEEAEDSDNPKHELVELLLSSTKATMNEKHEQMRKRFESLRMKALLEHAESLGVDEDLVEEAESSQAPKQALIELLLQQH